MIRKYHNHKPQTTLWHREEEPLNHHETPGRLIKQSNQLSLPIKMIAILERTQSNVKQNIKQLQTPTMGVTINKCQQPNQGLRTDSSLSHRGGGGGINAFYWYQIFALDSAVVEVQEMFSSHGGHLTNAIYHHGET